LTPGLQIAGRIDGAIHSGGETVFPEQLEERLMVAIQAASLPVSAVLLLGVDDPEWGQRLVALIRFAEGAVHTKEWSRLEVRLRAMTACWMPAERPVAWHHCAALEPTAAGKWQRKRWQNWLLSQESGDMP
jgi:O-succinylbenzoic acid--CoA ligase